MDTFNRVFIALLSLIAVLIALTALLIGFGAIPTAWAAAIFEAVQQFTLDNFLIVAPISLAALVIILVLSLLWFRAQFGAISENRLPIFTKGRPIRNTEITATALEKALRRTAEEIPGVISAASKINLGHDSIDANISVVIPPSKDIDRIDELLRANVSRDWDRMFGIRPTRLDIAFRVTGEVPRAA